MSHTENTDQAARPGLTKPLVNNVGGVIDQDAPSADQLLTGQPDPTWGDTPLGDGDRGVHHEDTGGLIPGFERGIGRPGDE